MSKNKKIIISLVCVVVILLAVVLPSILYALGIIDYAKIATSTQGKYLFVYFTGNDPQEERVRFALSTDGYNFQPVNDNQAVIEQTLGTKSVRDPYILRASDKEGYYIIGTDMRSNDGWASNHTFVVWYSQNLVDWTDERIIDVEEYGLSGTVRAWAPQALWDEEKGMYMVYWSNCQVENDVWTPTVLWYAYSKDLTKLDTQPQILYAPSNGHDAIDGDIIYKDGVYYLYYKDEVEKKICYVTSDKLTGPYSEPEDKQVSLYYTNVEGNFMYNIAGTDTYVMMIDCYSKHKFVIQQTDDMVNFKRVNPAQYTLDFSPRHGSVLHITNEEYDRIKEYFG